METQSQPQLRGAALFRKMLDNKKLIEANTVCSQKYVILSKSYISPSCNKMFMVD